MLVNTLLNCSNPNSLIEPIFQDGEMVTSEFNFTGKKRFNRPEPSISSIISCNRLLMFIDLNLIDDAYDVFAWVALRIAHDHQEFCISTIHARFFLEFA